MYGGSLANVLSVFVSSGCYELRDLRAAIRDFLKSLGINSQLSEDPGFPRASGDKPYVTCIRNLSECPLVIGLLERTVGTPLPDWSPFADYNGLCPTHAELRHALGTKKKVLLYIHRATIDAYHQWKNSRATYVANAGSPELAMLELIHELMTNDPAPYFEPFNDASDVIASLRLNLFNEIYASLKQQEAESRGQAEYLLEKILGAAPEIRASIQSQLNQGLVDELAQLHQDRDRLEQQVAGAHEASQSSAEEKNRLDARISELEEREKKSRMMLTMAAVRDIRWLEHVRTTMMPKQPSRVPFHNTAEVAMRGFHAAAGGRVMPILREVTWSKLLETENGLHRGYKAGIIFKGESFVPGVTVAYRRIGEGLPAGNTDYHWQMLSIYFGDYLELASGDNEPEAALSWRGYEFQAKNPTGQTSEWVAFTYPFDDTMLSAILEENKQEGRRLAAAGANQAAIEPLRKAMVFADRMLGIDAPLTVELRSEHNKALDNATLDRCRFRVGKRVKIISGEHMGKSGMIEKIGLRHFYPYYVAISEGQTVQAKDDEVEEVI
jgi:hypothetical protein